MAERSILYICEGPKDEPGFVHAFMKKAFANIEYRIKATASPWGYKELVQKTGCHIDLRRWGYDIFISVAVQNIRKTWWMLHSDNRLPDVDEYASIDWARVFDMELDHFTKTDTVYVLNTFVFAIIDFAPSVFFKLAQKHSIKFGNT